MAAQKQGIAITPELTAQIEAQARAYATAELNSQPSDDAPKTGAVQPPPADEPKEDDNEPQ